MIRSSFINLFLGATFSLGAFGGIIILVKASGLVATSGTPLTADTWNTMVSNFFWGSGNGGIYYNGKVGIGTSSPNKELHIKTSAGTNAELNIQSGTQPHWAIYHDETSQELRVRNGVNRVTISNGGNLNAQGLCINGDCKTSWTQVASAGSNLGVYQFTGTSDTCNSTNAGKVKYTSAKLYFCDGTNRLKLSGGANIQLYNGARRWDDGSYSKSCKEYRNPSGNYFYLGDTGDGDYWIDPLNSGSPFKAYCDMTNGGWTLVIAGKGGNASGFITASDLNSTTNYQGGNTFKFSDAKINAISKTAYKIQNFWNSKTRYVKGTCSLNTTSGASGDCIVGYRDEAFTNIVTSGNNGGSGYYGISFWRGTPDVRAFIFYSGGWEESDEDVASTRCDGTSVGCDMKIWVK